MGSTFVHIGEQGFWVSDGLLELWLRFLALHIEDPAESGALATMIRDQWLLASRGFFNGCVPHGLAAAVVMKEGATLVRAAVESLLGALQTAPSHLSKGVLNLMGFGGCEFGRDVETWRLVEVGQAFLDLLDGKITAGPGDPALMPGSHRHAD